MPILRGSINIISGHYSRDGRDSKKRMEEELEEMMRGADGEHREIIRRTLEEIRQS